MAPSSKARPATPGPEGGEPLRELVTGLPFPESPRWHDGALHFSDHQLGLVHRLGDDGLSTLCELPAGASGFGWLPGGEMLVSSMYDRRVVRVERDGTLVEHADLSALAGGPVNDMLVDAEGRAYVGNFGSDVAAGEPLVSASLVRVDPDGAVAVVADDLVFPNGMVLTPRGDTLIVAESFAHRLTAFDVAADGSLSGRRLFARLGEPPTPLSIEAASGAGWPVPDGIALDETGAVWVADPRGDAVLRVREGGEIVDRVATGERSAYAVTLGGEDRRTLYACANEPLGRVDPAARRDGAVLSTRVPVPGAGRP